ncbi:alpha/beta hydrolase [Paenibacillus tarimensis]
MSTTILSPLPMEGGFSPNTYSGKSPGSGQGPPYSPNVPVSEQARRKHIAIAILSSVLAFIMLIVVAFHGYIAWTLAYPYVAPLTSNPMEAKNLNYTEFAIPSMSGKTTVNGWYIPAPSEIASARTIVFSHGYGANREEPWVPMYDLAGLLHALNYNIVMFDYGYASPTNKKPATGGFEESQQLLSSIQYAREMGADEIIVWGFSMGAGTALQTALQTDLINAMILDSMFLPDPDTLFHNVTQLVNLPRYPSLPLLQTLLPLWTGTSFDQIPAEQVKQTSFSIPVYLIHGTADKKAPVAIAEAIAEVQSNPLSKTWIVEDGHHEMLYRLHPKEYIQRAAKFLSQVHYQSAVASAT